MATERFSRDLLGPIILETRDRLARIEARLGAIEGRLEHHQDELNVVSGLAMRAIGGARHLGQPAEAVCQAGRARGGVGAR